MESSDDRLTAESDTPRSESSQSQSQNDPMKLTRTDIEKMIADSNPRLSFVNKEGSRTKSDIWDRFQIVRVDQKSVEFIKCKSCPVVYSCKKGLGTSTPARHACSDVAGKNKLKTAINQPSVSSFVKKHVPKTAIDDLNTQVLIGLAKDLRPLGAVEGNGFKLMAQALINFGSKYGIQNIDDVLCHRTTLKTKYLPKAVETFEEQLRRNLQTTSPDFSFAFTTDMWSEKYQQRNFLSLHVHFININWKLMSHMLDVVEFNDKKTTENIRNSIKIIIRKYFNEEETQKIMEKLYAVTDGGTNFRKVFINRLPCYCHRINLAIQWTLNQHAIPQEKPGNPTPIKKLFNLETKCPAFKDVLDQIKKVVEFFKRSGHNKDLPTSLKQEVQTRWNSTLTMLESYDKVSDEAKTILTEKRKYDLIPTFSDDVARQLIKFLKPVRECSELLSSDKRPTIHMIAIWHYKLQKHFEANEGDSPQLSLLKEQARVCFEEYFEIEDVHYAACILHP